MNTPSVYHPAARISIYITPAGLTTGTCSLPCGPRWAWRILGKSLVALTGLLAFASPSAAAARLAVVANVLFPSRTTLVTDRSGRNIACREAILSVVQCLSSQCLPLLHHRSMMRAVTGWPVASRSLAILQCLSGSLLDRRHLHCTPPLPPFHPHPHLRDLHHIPHPALLLIYCSSALALQRGRRRYLHTSATRHATRFIRHRTPSYHSSDNVEISTRPVYRGGRGGSVSVVYRRVRSRRPGLQALSVWLPSAPLFTPSR